MRVVRMNVPRVRVKFCVDMTRVHMSVWVGCDVSLMRCRRHVAMRVLQRRRVCATVSECVRMCLCMCVCMWLMMRRSVTPCM